MEMKKRAADQPKERRIAPQRMWTTLSVLEQKAVLQIVVRICQEAIAKWAQEEKHESTANH